MNKILLNNTELEKIKNILNSENGVIAFPTDTVWGVGCLVENKNAISRIYSAKNRSKNKPLILLGSKIDHLIPYINEINDKAMDIINRYLPGAVTLILPKSSKTPDYVTSGFSTVGIRIPKHPVILEILEHAVDNHVLATTSANIAGENAGVSRKDVINSLGDEVDFILNDYELKVDGTASTIIAFDEQNEIKILRQGDIKII